MNFASLRESALVDELRKGHIGVLPTDTVYGLVARAQDKQAAERILSVKGRKYKPGTLIASNTGQLIELGIKPRYLKAVEHFWPGAISVVLPFPPELDYLHSVATSFPVRIP